MVRASAVAERARVPTASLVCEGFVGQATTTASGLGLPTLPLAPVPGHVDVQSGEELRQNVLAVTVDAVVRALTVTPAPAAATVEPGPEDLVAEGTTDEIDRLFYEREWSDGLPIVPPTAERVRAFLRHTDRPAHEELGVLLPDHRVATVWNTAVNGVMAVAGFLPGKTDKGTFGGTWRVVLAEDEDGLARLGWPSLAGDQGVPAGESAVTVGRYTTGATIGSAFAADPDRLIAYLADGLVKHVGWEFVFSVWRGASLRPLLVLSPILAGALARAGLSKDEVRRRLHAQARLPARVVERYIGEWTNIVPGRPRLHDLARAGEIPAVFGESGDPDRLVPVAVRPEDIMIAVSGDPLRTNAHTFVSNGMHGFPTTRRVHLLPAGRD